MKTIFSLPVFLVDDNETCLKVYRHFLEQIGFLNISTFSDSSEFLSQLHMKPAVIFLDYFMDNVNGLDTLLKVKRNDPNIPVVFISGQQDINIAVDVLKYGALDYVTKKEVCVPRLEEVMQKVARLIQMNPTKKSRSFLKRFL